MYKVVAGHKGIIVGDHKYMIERTVKQSLRKIHIRREWDSKSMSTISRYYLEDGTPYNAMIHGPSVIKN